MYCPFCGHVETKVNDSRLAGEGRQIRRRRECLSCGERFTTFETAELVMEDKSLLLLCRLYEAGVLEPYVLLRLGDEDIAKDYSAYRAKNRDKLEKYMDKFVVPPAPARANPGTARTAGPPR